MPPFEVLLPPDDSPEHLISVLEALSMQRLVLANLADLYTAASVSGHLSYVDFQGIQVALQSSHTQGEERRCLQRLVYAVRRGHVRLVS